MIYLFDSNTGEEIIREQNDAEYAQALIDKAQFEKEQAEAGSLAETKRAAKAEALAALGLSQEVINLLAD